MRRRFDEELQLLNKKLIEMGAQCEEVIRLAAAALTEGRAEQVQKVKPMDAEIDRMERDIESLCLKLLLQQQPVARDLRQISAALKMITDMERIGDQAASFSSVQPPRILPLRSTARFFLVARCSCCRALRPRILSSFWTER